MNKDTTKLYIEQTHDGFVFRIHEYHLYYAEVMERYDDYLPGVVSNDEYVGPLWVEFSSRYLSVVMDLTKIAGFDNLDITDTF